MAKKPPAPKGPTANDLALLGQCVDAINDLTKAPSMTADAMKFWLEYPGGPYVECNDVITARAGKDVLWRATVAGREYSAIHGRPTAAPSAPQPQAPTNGETVQQIVFDDDIPIPESKRGGRTPGTAIDYGFERMGVGQSFHLPQTEENPKPAKRIAALVSTATKNLSPKHFVVRAVDETDPRGPGARVFRERDFTPKELHAREEAARAAAAAKAAEAAKATAPAA